MGRTLQLHERERALQDHPHSLCPSLHSELKVRDRSLICQAASVLSEPDPQCKADQTRTLAKLWNDRQLATGSHDDAHLRERPSRDDSRVKVVAPGKVPSLGKGGSLASRQAILHSLVHIESWAVDLSWDIVARFGQDPVYSLPDAFLDDFVQVACDEASHFQQLQQRLQAIGSHYGALPVHDGLWESAAATAHSLPARLAVESCVHEARGLDRLPHTIQRFRNAGDSESAQLLETIYQEEIAHCAAGVRWLTYLHRQARSAACTHDSLGLAAQLQNATLRDNLSTNQPSAATGSLHSTCSPNSEPVGDHVHSSTTLIALDTTAANIAEPMQELCANGTSCDAQRQTAPSECATDSHSKETASHSASIHDWQADAQQYHAVEDWFRALVRAHFKGSLKPPFNEAARAAAGFGPNWYLPLSKEYSTDDYAASHNSETTQSSSKQNPLGCASMADKATGFGLSVDPETKVSKLRSVRCTCLQP